MRKLGFITRGKAGGKAGGRVGGISTIEMSSTQTKITPLNRWQKCE